jgi:hypothetical protein
MTREEFNTLGIPSQCRQPDPLECYERQASYEQSETGLCRRCPIASWVTTMMISGAWTSASVGFDGPGQEVVAFGMVPAPEHIEKASASFQEASLGVKAA